MTGPGSRPRPRPERTCVGCRSKGAKSELVRVVREPGGRVVVDRTGRVAGRGVYLHPARDCVDRATRSGALGRALKTGLGPAEAASLMKEVRDAMGEGA